VPPAVSDPHSVRCQVAQHSSVLVCGMQGSMASFLHLHAELQVAIFDMLDITDR